MTRIANILQDARDLLSDTQGVRWKDDQLLRYLSIGNRELAKATGHYRGSINIPLIFGRHTYNLPKDLLLIYNVWYQSRRLPVGSIAQLTSTEAEIKSDQGFRNLSNVFGPHNTYGSTILTQTTWRNDVTEGFIQAIITEDESFDSFRVYPIPMNPELPKTLADVFPDNDLPGMVDLAEDDEAGIIDVITGRSYADNFTQKHGIISSLSSQDFVTITYSKLPPQITSKEDTLHCKEAYDIALKYYVLSNAYMADTDLRSAEKAQYYMQLYLLQVNQAQQEATLNNTSTNLLSTKYRPLG